jgi:hypothetical protein
MVEHKTRVLETQTDADPEKTLSRDRSALGHNRSALREKIASVYARTNRESQSLKAPSSKEKCRQ